MIKQLLILTMLLEMFKPITICSFEQPDIAGFSFNSEPAILPADVLGSLLLGSRSACDSICPSFRSNHPQEHGLFQDVTPSSW